MDNHNERAELPKVTAKIEKTFDTPGKKLRGIATLYIGNAFAVHGIRVMTSEKGLFVQMPQNSYEQNGVRKFSDIFHPVTAEARAAMNQTVLDAYEKELGKQLCSDRDLMDIFGPSM